MAEQQRDTEEKKLFLAPTHRNSTVVVKHPETGATFLTTPKRFEKKFRAKGYEITHSYDGGQKVLHDSAGRELTEGPSTVPGKSVGGASSAGLEVITGDGAREIAQEVARAAVEEAAAKAAAAASGNAIAQAGGLSGFTVDGLRTMVAAKGIEGASEMSREQLEAALTASE